MSSRLPVFDRRRAGVLLHLSSLDAALGRGGRAFIDWMADAGFSVWQILPVGPTGKDGSPYWVRSDNAGNTLLLDPEEWPEPSGVEYDTFLRASHDWLDDYVAFEALSALHHGAAWWDWPPEYRDREPGAMARVHRDLADQMEQARRAQFAFAWQWRRLRDYAHARGVRLFGDVPFYLSPDSAETWSQRSQFQLDANGRPQFVAGVPPDYFSETGQLWGNPLYRWDVMLQDDFRFWRARIRQQLERVDVLRIDHFRALSEHWAIPAGAADARTGSWQKTPGRELLQRLREEHGDLPIIAEDLGIITPEVDALRREFGLPGMRVLQFGFGGDPNDLHLPHMHERDSVVYTGTHDNDTTLGWYRSLDENTRQRVDFFLRVTEGSMPEVLIRAALGSVGRLAIIPMQDLLGLGSDCRLNTPGTNAGNWSWRLPEGALSRDVAQRFLSLNRIYGRT
jgi:4-alpha-glucanotransferase